MGARVTPQPTRGRGATPKHSNWSLPVVLLGLVLFGFSPRQAVGDSDLPPVVDRDAPAESHVNDDKHDWLVKFNDDVSRDEIEDICDEASNHNVTFADSVRSQKQAMHALRAQLRAQGTADGFGPVRSQSERVTAKAVQRFKRACVRKASRMGVLNVRVEDDNHLEEVRQMWAESIDYIQPNYKVHSLDYDYNYPTKSWALDRIDQQDLPLDGFYDPPPAAEGGKMVHVYIVDTGIRKTHQEFEGRVGEGVDFIDLDFDPNDCNGHGTHCAGVVGGYTWGVAKQCTLHAVRVLDCEGEGSTMDVISGLEWVLDNHPSLHPGTRAVVSMSLGGLGSGAMNHAVAQMASENYPTTVAAGNEGGNSCMYSPSSCRSSISVGSHTELDQVAKFSNTGRCVDFFAPGTNILSAGIDSDKSTMLMSGTSCSAPMASGAAALYLHLEPEATSDQVGAALVAAATQDKLMQNGLGANSPNLILNVANLADVEISALSVPPSGQGSNHAQSVDSHFRAFTRSVPSGSGGGGASAQAVSTRFAAKNADTNETAWVTTDTVTALNEDGTKKGLFITQTYFFTAAATVGGPGRLSALLGVVGVVAAAACVGYRRRAPCAVGGGAGEAYVSYQGELELTANEDEDDAAGEETQLLSPGPLGVC